ncbi:MAG: T9SS type A sorting domain-containing protein, partial [Ignavibacteria bacterium]|nr:T9SS type A sorting domain-containing protein [Ignavibacteria bacterium]
NNGWTVGDAGTILRSRDGGLTWTPQFSGVASNFLAAVYFVDAMNGWVTGEGGTILHTSDGGGIVGIETNETASKLPENFLLSQNYPNPFNPSTTISWQQPEVGHVTLKIFDVLGREVSTLLNEELNAGKHETTFDASQFSSGIYFYQINAGKYIETKKMLLMK